MIYASLKDIPYQRSYAVIVNVGTRLVTTLALMSAIKRSDMPVLLIDCAYKDKNDYDFFRLLQDDYDFGLISMPLRHHGDTLDILFTQLHTDYILLVDSDLEIKSDSLVPEMMRLMSHDKVFGAGFYQSALWLKKGINWEEPRDGYYEERMWIPLTLLKVTCVREALVANKSFGIRTMYNILPKFQNFSRRLLYSHKLSKCKWLSQSEYHMFDIFKKVYVGHRPLITLHDTGSDVYMYLKYEKELFFAGFDSNTDIQNEYLKHYSGITRKLMYDDPYNTGSLDEDCVEILDRLKNIYGFDYKKWNKINA